MTWRSEGPARISRWGPVAGTAAVIYGVSILPAGPGSGGTVTVSLFLHVVAYMGLAAVTFRAVRYRKGMRGGVVVGCALFGLLIEVQQYTLPTRYFSLLDAAANTAGVAVATVVLPPVRSIVQEWYPEAGLWRRAR